jgi:hypothetical protein
MRCQMCGAELGENDSFCYECGFNMSSSDSEIPLSSSGAENMSSSDSQAPLTNSIAENMEDKPIQSRFLEISTEQSIENDLELMDATFEEETYYTNSSSEEGGLANALHYDLHEADHGLNFDGSKKRSLLFPALLILLGTLIVGYGALSFMLSGSGDAIPFVPIFSNQTDNTTPVNTSYNDSQVNTTPKNTTPVTCSLCDGTGTITCPTCHGACFLKCSECGGDGLIGSQVCSVCGGKGNVICTKCKCTGIITCTKCKGTGMTSK